MTIDARHGSKDGNILKHAHLLGKIPDAEVAKLSNVSVRTVASFRARNKIPGYNGPRRKAPPTAGRVSRLERFMDILGKVPDRVVADKSGMSLGAVRNFRIKHGIAASGRVPESEDTASRFRPTLVGGGGVPKTEPTKITKLWKAVLIDSDENQVRVLFVGADSIATAAEQAKRVETAEARIGLLVQTGDFLI